jgi:hypothetical protein
VRQVEMGRERERERGESNDVKRVGLSGSLS